LNSSVCPFSSIIARLLVVKEPSHDDVLANARLAFSDFLWHVGKRPWSFFHRWACVGDVTRSLANVAKRSSEEKFLSMHKNFFSVQRSPTFENKRCETFAKRYVHVYGMKSFSSLDYRSACVWGSYRKRWHSLALYIACYKGWADQLCGSGVGTPWRMRRGCVACTWLQQDSMKSVNDSAILTRLVGCCWRTGSTRRFIKIALRKRSCSKEWQVLFLRRPAASSLCRDLCQSCSSTDFYDTKQWWRRLPAFLYRMRNDVMTALLERHVVAGRSLLSRFVR